MSATRLWATAADGEAADTKPGELAVLHDHVLQCKARSARMAALHCGVLRVRGFVQARQVTTLALGTALAALLWAGL